MQSSRKREVTLIKFADLLQVLADREWHTGLELIRHFEHEIPPQRAASFFYFKKHTTPDHYPEDHAIRSGIIEMLLPVLMFGCQQGLIERERGKACSISGSKYRYIGWYCAMCGERMRGRPERPEHGLCDTCKEWVDAATTA